ncbi:hypothetical protein SAMN05216275_14125 [Streptosporangium canum]|uniref:Uncharacterized protein n=1 Tax=Streptosporangium canum TaxID=324952 RepID=A0A1I4DG43_9ACTN|nr:hypothetical protein [Streptosporangium canum]SFK91879.1 hypothetical protein SAMN05216275_14125 [Streptosporangium canum]
MSIATYLYSVVTVLAAGTAIWAVQARSLWGAALAVAVLLAAAACTAYTLRPAEPVRAPAAVLEA